MSNLDSIPKELLVFCINFCSPLDRVYFSLVAKRFQCFAHFQSVKKRERVCDQRLNYQRAPKDKMRYWPVTAGGFLPFTINQKFIINHNEYMGHFLTYRPLSDIKLVFGDKAITSYVDLLYLNHHYEVFVQAYHIKKGKVAVTSSSDQEQAFWDKLSYGLSFYDKLFDQGNLTQSKIEQRVNFLISQKIQPVWAYHKR